MKLMLTLILDTKIDKALDSKTNYDLINSLIKSNPSATDKVKAILEKTFKIDLSKVKVYEQGDLVLVYETNRSRLFLKELT